MRLATANVNSNQTIASMKPIRTRPTNDGRYDSKLENARLVASFGRRARYRTYNPNIIWLVRSHHDSTGRVDMVAESVVPPATKSEGYTIPPAAGLIRYSSPLPWICAIAISLGLWS